LRDAQLGQMTGRPDAGSQEDGGATERARGQDDLARSEKLAIDELHVDGALVFDNDAVHFSVAADDEVTASADRGREIGNPRIDAHTVGDVERIGADAMLGRALEIRYMRQADRASTKARIDGVFSSAVRWRIGSGPVRSCQVSSPVGVFSRGPCTRQAPAHRTIPRSLARPT
jgi:hypothetical protein